MYTTPWNSHAQTKAVLTSGEHTLQTAAAPNIRATAFSLRGKSLTALIFTKKAISPTFSPPLFVTLGTQRLPTREGANPPPSGESRP